MTYSLTTAHHLHHHLHQRLRCRCPPAVDARRLSVREEVAVTSSTPCLDVAASVCPSLSATRLNVSITRDFSPISCNFENELRFGDWFVFMNCVMLVKNIIKANRNSLGDKVIILCAVMYM